MVVAQQVLKWTSLSRAISEMKMAATFIDQLVFGSTEIQETRSIELSIERRGREMAPFISRGAEAYLVGGDSSEFFQITPPNIRIKRPLHVGQLLNDRAPGSTIFINGSTRSSIVRRKIAEALGRLEFMIRNSEEFLACQAINGLISYNPTDAGAFSGLVTHRRDFDTFTVDFSGLGYQTRTLTSTNTWNTAAASYTGDPAVDFLNVKRDISDEVGLAPTHAIFGRTAAEYFLKLQKVKDLLDVRRLMAGGIDITNQFNEQGALYMGNFAGVQCWEYQHTMLHFQPIKISGYLESNAGSTSNPIFPTLIPDDAVIFLSLLPSAEFRKYYGAIEDLPQLQGRSAAGRRFAKSWVQEDPPVRYLLAESHPLPFLRRAGAVCRLEPLT